MNNPFEDVHPLEGADDRSLAIQQARDEMAIGQTASVSLAPAYNNLRELVNWMASRPEYDKRHMADAVSNPVNYWPKYATWKGIHG